MKRSTIICLIALVFFSFGYRFNKQSDGVISKIYLHNSLLIRSTPEREIALYDVSDPRSPREVSTIDIGGNHDVAVKGNYLYTDSYQDLIVYDISRPSDPAAIDTIKRVFTFYNVNDWRGTGGGGQVDNWNDDSWEAGGSSGCAHEGCSSGPTSNSDITSDSDTLWKQSIDDVRNGGKGGSMARFVIVDSYLYCINDMSLTVYDIADPSRPRYKNTINVGWGIETLFPYKNYLFMGGVQGMYVYDISDRSNPTYYSEFTHARSCDPVVADGDRAYVTLRSGSPCGDIEDQLQVIDIGNLRDPKSISTYSMNNPYGLTVKDQKVVVCDGTNGLAVLDASNPRNIKKVGEIRDITPYDVLHEGNLLVVTSDTGFHLYDISNPAQPTELSTLR
jgi:hypothetical protein